MRRVLTSLGLGLLGPLALIGAAVPGSVVSAAPAAAACPTDPLPHLAAAPVVFTAVVQSSAPTPAPQGYANWISQVSVDHIYKGDVTTSSVQVSTWQKQHACGARQLTAGTRYLFEVVPAGSTWRVVGGKAGAQPATAPLLSQVAAQVGPGTAVTATPPAPTSATFTRVAPLRPHRLSRVAAPGVALVIVGLLGLLVVRRRAR